MENKMITNEQLANELHDVMIGLNKSVLCDNEGEIIGYMEEHQCHNHAELLKVKNDLIERGEMTQTGFSLILFNYGENDEIILSELRFSYVDKNGDIVSTQN